MELLGRRAGEVVKIGENVRITVMDVWHDYVLLAVETPSGVQILRQERQQPALNEEADLSKTILVQGNKALWQVTTTIR